MARETENGSGRRRQWGALAVASGLLLATIWGASTVLAAEPARVPEQTGTQPATPVVPDAQLQAETPASAAAASALLAQALFTGDADALSELVSPEMRFVTWLGQRRVVEADEVLQDMAELYFGPADAPYLDLTTDLLPFFGVEPEVLWGEEWPVVDVLFVRGLGETGETDALLAVTEEEPGTFRWGGMLVAPFGFGLPAAEPGVLPTLPAPDPDASPAKESAAAQLRIKRTTNVYPEPVFDVPPSGLVRSGQEVSLLETSADGEYLRIACVADLPEPCWVVNDPAAVAIIGGPEATTAPVLLAGATPTPSPASLAPAGEAEEILFGRGEFAVTRTGMVSGDVPRDYFIRLEPRQLLYVSLTSPNDAANFSVTGLTNGQPYKRIVNEERSFSFVVPATQEYGISVQAPADQTTPLEYALTVVALPAPSQAPIEATPLLVPTRSATSVPTLAPATATPRPVPTLSPPSPTPPSPTPLVPTPAPTTDATDPGATTASARVRFAPGETSAERSGQVSQGQSSAYVLRVLSGQTLSVEIETLGSSARFSVSGVSDGATYSGFDDTANPVVFVAPRTQDYLITVVSEAPADYLLRFVVPPLESVAPTPPPNDPPGTNRLTITPGAVSAGAGGVLAPYGTDSYVLAAQAGQEATFVVQSPDAIADFELRDPNGYLLKGLNNGSRVWSGQLPTSGDYTIVVYNNRGVRVQYTVEATILPATAAVNLPLS